MRIWDVMELSVSRLWTYENGRSQARGVIFLCTFISAAVKQERREAGTMLTFVLCVPVMLYTMLIYTDLSVVMVRKWRMVEAEAGTERHTGAASFEAFY